MTAQKTLPRTFLLTAAPGVTSDKAHGYLAGDRVIDTTHLLEYFCTSDAVGAAVWVANASVEGAVFEDAEFAIEDQDDHSKQLQFSVGGQATATVATIATPAITASRTYNLPLIGADDTLAVLGTAQTFTADQYFTGNVGIGTTNPQRKLHLSISNVATFTAFAYENTDTTDGNGLVNSFRTATTGVGAATFQELAAVQIAFVTHNHATRAASYAVYTSAGGAAAERFKINSDATVDINLNTDLVTSLGYGKFGLATAGTAADFYIGINGHMTSTDYAVRVKAAGDLVLNTPTGRSIAMRVNNVEWVNLSATAMSIAVPTTILYSGAQFTVGDGTGNTAININGGAGSVRDLGFKSAGVVRWIMRVDGAVAESGADAGSPLEIIARDDAGLQIDIPITMVRAASGTITIARPVAVQINTDNIFVTGYGKMGLATSGTSTTFYLAQTSNFTSVAYALQQDASGTTALNAKTGQTLRLRINNSNLLSFSANSATFASGVPTTVADTTDSSSSITGAFICSGGAGIAKVLCVGTNIFATGATSTINVGSNTATAPYFVTNAAAGNTRELRSQTAGSLRWRFILGNATAEGGSNAGSDINLAAYDDSGTVIDTVWTLSRVATGVFTIARPVTISGSNAFKVGGLTSGRVTFATSAGQLTDAAGLTYASAGTLTLGDGAAAAATNMILNGVVAQERSFQFSTTGSRRWRIIANAATESGSNLGSTFSVTAYDDSGTLIDSPITIARAAAGSITFSRPLTCSAAVGVNSTIATQLTDAITNVASACLTLAHFSSGTPAAGFGTRITMNGHSDTNTNRNLAIIDAVWVTATDATRTSSLRFNAYNGGTNVSVLVLDASLSTSYGRANFAGEIAPGNNLAAYETGLTTPVMYGTTNTGGAYPFTQAGHLIISPRISGASRDVIFATGATPTETLIVTGTNRVMIGSTTDDAANKLQLTGNMSVTGAAGADRQIAFQTAAVNRWLIDCDAIAEGGADAGSGLQIKARTDAGAAIDSPIAIARISGGTITLGGSTTRPITSTGAITVSYAPAAATSPAFLGAGTSAITGNVADGYTTSHRFNPTYSGAFTVTRHNYLDMKDAVLAAGAALTDACVFRFDAAAGTHKALLAATTKTTPSAVDAWMKHNVAGTLMYGPLYLSTTA